ncbi:MAG: DUF5615 family PIN-like protein [Verrucomicrobia bacterium]|nr:DUF5615 family PIN-like protein [Verrucomicrobiota bacterium]
MTVVVDNCLPVSWVEWLEQHGHTARHWRELGPPNAPDVDVMRWAVANKAVVLTQDLDFTKLLFQTRAALPSVIQLRLDDVRPRFVGQDVVKILAQHGESLRRRVFSVTWFPISNPSRSFAGRERDLFGVQPLGCFGHAEAAFGSPRRPQRGAHQLLVVAGEDVAVRVSRRDPRALSGPKR